MCLVTRRDSQGLSGCGIDHGIRNRTCELAVRRLEPLVFRDLRETNDGRRAAVRTASALFYAAVGVVVVMVVLLCVLFFIAG